MNGDSSLYTCCGRLEWKHAILLIAVFDIISVSLCTYSTSGATLGAAENRLGISRFFDIDLQEGEGATSSHYALYVVGCLLCLFRLITTGGLAFGAMYYWPCYVSLWIISATAGWIIFFVMQVILVNRYYGANNQVAAFWQVWNDVELFSSNSTEVMKLKANEILKAENTFGQPCVNIISILCFSLIFTVISSMLVTKFYRKQTTHQIR